MSPTCYGCFTVDGDSVRWNADGKISKYNIVSLISVCARHDITTHHSLHEISLLKNSLFKKIGDKDSVYAYKVLSDINREFNKTSSIVKPISTIKKKAIKRKPKRVVKKSS